MVIEDVSISPYLFISLHVVLWCNQVQLIALRQTCRDAFLRLVLILFLFVPVALVSSRIAVSIESPCYMKEVRLLKHNYFLIIYCLSPSVPIAYDCLMVFNQPGDQPLSRSSSQEMPLSRSSSQDVEEFVDDLRPVTAPVTPPAPMPMITSVSVPPPVPVMAPPAPVPMLTYASAPSPVLAMAHQPQGNESAGSSSIAGEAGMVMPQVMPPYGYPPMMIPAPHYVQAVFPFPYYGYAPMFYGPPVSMQASSPGTVQVSHEPVRPVAVHSAPPVNVEDLYNMSKLNLKGDSSTNGVAPNLVLPPNPNGRPERQSAFHGKGPENGSSNGLIPTK